MIAPVPCIYKAEIRQQPKPAFVCTSKKKEEKSFKNILDHAVKRGGGMQHKHTDLSRITGRTT